MGVQVILLERYSYLGGLWTGGLVLPILSTHGLSPQKEWTKVVWGFSHEIHERLKAMDMVVNDLAPHVDPEACKYVLEQFCEEAGVRIIYHSWASDLLMSGDRIDAIFLETKSGPIAVKGKNFVDASGDGDLIAWSGEDFIEINHHIGAMYRIGGVSEDMDKVGEGIYLLETPQQTGVRVTRILQSVGNVTYEGSMTYKTYDDAIGMGGGSASLMYQGRKIKASERPYWQIPYTSILPKKCHNLLVAGRCFGFKEELAYDAREISTCLVTGQAAGIASAQAVMNRTSVQDVDVRALRKNLLAQNARLE